MDNTPGMLNAITTIVKDMGLNIIEYSSKMISSDEAEQHFSVEVKSVEESNALMNKFQQIKGMRKIKKV